MTLVLMDPREDSIPRKQASAPTIRVRDQTEFAGPVNQPWIQWGNVQEFVWRKVELPIDGLADELAGLRILHLSDFHTRNFWPAVYDTLLDRIAKSPPDLILFTGDFVESRRDHMPAVPHVKRLVEGFRARLGCYGTLGNHDLYHFAPHLDGTNVRLLEGDRRLLTRRNSGIEVIGFPGVHPSDLKESFLRSLPPLGERTLRIVMSHYPNHLHHAQRLGAQLFLTGHTHGGQVCLPGGKPIITHSSLPYKYCRGIHELEKTWLVVNHGLGFSGLPLRVMCPPEVIELTLTRAR